MNVPLRCQCGALEGMAEDLSPAVGVRAICYCDDCQAYAHHLGRAHDVLDENAGSDIFGTSPSRVKILRGNDQLKCLRLSEKGIYRWYAGCCQTPIANSAATPKLAYAGLFNIIMDFEKPPVDPDKIIGPLRFGLQGRFALGTPPTWVASRVSVAFLMKVAKFALTSFIRGTAQPSPFFNEAFEPRVKPYVLTVAERDLLRPLCGPNPHDQPAY